MVTLIGISCDKYTCELGESIIFQTIGSSGDYQIWVDNESMLGFYDDGVLIGEIGNGVTSFEYTPSTGGIHNIIAHGKTADTTISITVNVPVLFDNLTIGNKEVSSLMINNKELQSIRINGVTIYESLYSLTLTVDKNIANTGQTVTYTATLTNNGNPVSGKTITFSNNKTAITDNNGEATYSEFFTTSEITLSATYNEIESETITVARGLVMNPTPSNISVTNYSSEEVTFYYAYKLATQYCPVQQKTLNPSETFTYNICKQSSTNQLASQRLCLNNTFNLSATIASANQSNWGQF